MLFYFCQHGHHAGEWRRVPLQSRIPHLRPRLGARGVMLSELTSPADNWTHYRLQTLTHPRFVGKTLGQLDTVELKVLRDTWLKLPHVQSLHMPNSSQTIARHMDVLHVQEAVKTLRP